MSPSTNPSPVFVGERTDLVEIESTDQSAYRIYTGDGNDTLIGGTDDYFSSGVGDDLLDVSNGGGGNRLFAGAGNDTLITGSGDLLSGATGEDQFILANGKLPDRANIIIDFEDGGDRLLIQNLGITDSNIAIIPDGNNVLISVNNTNIAKILGINPSVLTIDDTLPDNIIIS